MDRHERNAKLTALLPQIESQAKHYVLAYRPDLDPLEVSQEAAVSFLKRVSDDPTFLQQDDKAIVTRVVQDGWNAVRSQYRQERRQVSLMLEVDGEEYDGEELLASDEPGPEKTVVTADLQERVQQVVAGLKPAYRAVARGIMADLPKSKIMESIGAKPQAFTHYRRQLAHAFMAFES